MQKDPYDLTDLLGPTIEAMGYILWGIEYHHNSKNAILRIYIDHKEGISIDDCELVSHQVAGLLDVHDPITVPYTLEISSPGLDRYFFYPAQFADYLNQPISFQLRSAINNRRKFKAIVTEADNEHLTLKIEGEEESVTLPISNINRARLIIDL